MGADLARAFRQGRASRRLDQLFGKQGTARLHAVGAEQFRSRRTRGADPDLRSQPRADANAERDLSQRNGAARLRSEAGAAWSRLILGQSNPWLPALLVSPI